MTENGVMSATAPSYDTALSQQEKDELGRLLLGEADQRYATSVTDWLAEQVWTIDEASAEVRPWPAEKAYLTELLDQSRPPLSSRDEKNRAERAAAGLPRIQER